MCSVVIWRRLFNGMKIKKKKKKKCKIRFTRRQHTQKLT
jgi:hypothetical protein